MRILQVASSLHDWGGIERYVAYLAEGLTERGHEVTVACPSGSPLDRRVTTAKVHIDSGQFKLTALPTYLRLMRRERFDVIHTHFSPDFLAAPTAARWTRSSAVVMTRHVAIPWSRAKVRRYVGRVDRVVPVSEAVARVLRGCGVSPAKMTVAKAGCPALAISTEPGQTRKDLGIPENSFAVGFFGRLAEEKGIQLLVEVGKHLPETVRFEVFGRGPLQKQLETSGLHLHGFREDVGDCMAAMDAIVIPSTWEEAFPYSALEAMAVGKPVIASNVGGLPEIVEEGSTGLLFEKGDSMDLRRALLKLADDRALALAMGAEGQRIHAGEYTVAKMAERMEQVYMEAMNHRKK